MSKTKKRKKQHQHLGTVIFVAVGFLLLLGAATLAIRLTTPQNSNTITGPGPTNFEMR